MLQNAINQVQTNPKKLLLLDGIGAIVSAFLLGIVLTQLNDLVGIPIPTLYFLAFLPCLFAIFDFYHYQKNNNQVATPLRIIAILNLLYCCLSIGLGIYHFETITFLGWFYIVVEVMIVVGIAVWEIRVAGRL